MELIIGLLLGLVVGVVSFLVYQNTQRSKQGSAARNILSQAETEGRDIRKNADRDAEKIMDEARKQARDERDRAAEIEKKALDIEKKVLESEKRLEQKETKLDQKLDELVKKTEDLNLAKEALAREEELLLKKTEEISTKLSEVAKLSKEDAKKQLFAQIEDQYENDFLKHIEKKKNELRAREEEVCREILVNSMQQYASAVTAETTQSTIELESDDLKGRIIGKE